MCLYLLQLAVKVHCYMITRLLLVQQHNANTLPPSAIIICVVTVPDVSGSIAVLTDELSVVPVVSGDQTTNRSINSFVDAQRKGHNTKTI